MMKPALLAAVAILLTGSMASAADPIPASGTTWKGHFGVAKESPQGVLCLMARGFFQAATSPEMNDLIAAWLRDHPNAVVVPVADSAAPSDKSPAVRRTYAWIVDGAQNLNLDLVRQGCFVSRTQVIGTDQKLILPEAEYQAFVEKVITAGKEAEETKLGVWKNPPPE